MHPKSLCPNDIHMTYKSTTRIVKAELHAPEVHAVYASSGLRSVQISGKLRESCLRQA